MSFSNDSSPASSNGRRAQDGSANAPDHLALLSSKEKRRWHPTVTPTHCPPPSHKSSAIAPATQLRTLTYRECTSSGSRGTRTRCRCPSEHPCSRWRRCMRSPRPDQTDGRKDRGGWARPCWARPYRGCGTGHTGSDCISCLLRIGFGPRRAGLAVVAEIEGRPRADMAGLIMRNRSFNLD
jgi:hypothetical protein